MHEGPTENRLGELGSLYKYYYYNFIIIITNQQQRIVYNGHRRVH